VVRVQYGEGEQTRDPTREMAALRLVRKFSAAAPVAPVAPAAPVAPVAGSRWERMKRSKAGEERGGHGGSPSGGPGPQAAVLAEASVVVVTRGHVAVLVDAGLFNSTIHCETCGVRTQRTGRAVDPRTVSTLQ